jgi:hypothetical protein
MIFVFDCVEGRSRMLGTLSHTPILKQLYLKNRY